MHRTARDSFSKSEYFSLQVWKYQSLPSSECKVNNCVEQKGRQLETVNFCGLYLIEMAFFFNNSGTTQIQRFSLVLFSPVKKLSLNLTLSIKSFLIFLICITYLPNLTIIFL